MLPLRNKWQKKNSLCGGFLMKSPKDFLIDERMLNDTRFASQVHVAYVRFFEPYPKTPYAPSDHVLTDRELEAGRQKPVRDRSGNAGRCGTRIG